MSIQDPSSGEGNESGRTRTAADDAANRPHGGSGDPLPDSTAHLVPSGETTLTGGLDSSAPAEEGRTLQPSERFGDYELLEEIARGGMGIVYKARHLSLNRIVALKVIRSGRFSDEEDQRRFQIEAQAAAQLDHPHIVPVYEVGTCEGQSYFTMGYVEGRSLDAQLSEGPPPPREAAELLCLAAAAIDYAHQKGVIHRDIKPSNVLLTRRAEATSDSSRRRRHAAASPFEPRVTDFGLALRVETSERLTVTGQVLGTPTYMSPEQAAGKTDVGPSTDVYSLGAMLYRMLTGRPPFRAATLVETLLQVKMAEPVPPRQIKPGIPKDLETICLRCLEKEPHNRYATARELAEDLERFLLGETIRARPAPQWERFWKWGRRRPAVAILVLVIAASLVIGGAMLAILQQQRAEIADQRAENADLRASFAVNSGEMLRLTISASFREADFFDPARRTEREQTIANYEQLIPILERRVAGSDDPAEFRPQLASYYLNLGALQLTVGSPRTEESLLMAEGLFQEVLADDPANVEFRNGLATINFNLGEYYAGVGEFAEAEAAFNEALQHADSLPLERNSELRGRVLVEQGLLYANQGMLQEAEKDFRDAEPILASQLAAEPGDAAVARQLGRVQYSLGLICVQMLRYIEAKDHYDRALQTQQTLVNRFGSSNHSRHDLASTLTNHGQLVWQLGDTATADESLKRAVDESRILMELAPTDKAREILGRSSYHRASFLFSQQNVQDAVPLLEESLNALDTIEQDPVADLPTLRQLVRHGLLLASLQTGNHQRGFEMVQQMLPDSPTAAEDRFQGAGYCAQCATLAARDANLSDAEREMLIQQYGDLAVDLLREAIDAGFRDAQRLNNAPQWNFLRNRDDVQEIVREMEP